VTAPEEELVATEEQAKVLKLLGEIDQREAEVLKCHYGLNGRKPMTLKEIGEQMGLTRERIRQIQRIALTRLYGYMNMDHPE
jgi:RNA polymerase primary sigma factor